MTYFKNKTGDLVETYIPDPTKFEDTGVDMPARAGSVVRIGNTLYSFGGIDNLSAPINTICTANISNPLSWSISGSTLPFSMDAPRVVIIDDYLYIMGGQGNFTKILRSPVSDPLSWTDTGSVLPTRRDNAPIVMNDSYAYILHGHNGVFNLNTIARASLSNPTSWSDISGITGAINTHECSAFVFNNDVYSFGGVSYLRSIRRYNHALTFCKNYDNMFGVDIGHKPLCWHIGNSFYIIGYGAKSIVKVSANTPTSYDQSGSSYSSSSIFEDALTITNTYYLHQPSWCVDGYLYYHDWNSSGSIFRSKRTKVYAEQAPLDSNRALSAVTVDGLPTAITSSQRLGFQSWLTNRTDLL